MAHLILLAILFTPVALADSIDDDETTETHAAEAPTTEPDDPAALEHSRALAEYKQQAAEFEADGGALDPRLGETLLAMGLLQQEAGNHADALESFSRALHITRVNKGLHDLAQTPLLELVIEENTALGDWEALDENYDQLEWLYRRNGGAEWAEQIKSIANRRLAAYNRDLGGRGFIYLMKADAIYNRLLEDMADLPAHQDPRRDALYRSALINYHIGVAVLDFQVSYSELREGLIESGHGSFDVDENQARAVASEDAFNRSEVAIRQILAATKENQAEDPVAYAEALVFFGDWHLAQKQVWNGKRQYRRAREVLDEHNVDAAVRDRLFGQPVRIRPPPIPGMEDPPPGPDTPYAEALVTVPASGWPTDVRIIETHPDDDPRIAERARRLILSLRFRPRYEGTEPVTTTDVPVRYTFRK